MKLTKTRFFDHDAIDIKTKSCKIVIVTDCGPRIAFLGKIDGENLLFWDDKNRGRNDWKIMGGHRVWVARPAADEAEESYFADNEPCDIKIENNSVTILGAVDPVIKTQRGIRIEALDDNKLAVDNIVTNKSNMLYSGNVWALTCTNPNPKRQYGIPLGDDSAWDCFRIVYYRCWGGKHTSQVNDPQISLSQDMLRIDPQGIETKRMVEAPFGVIAMDAPDQNTTFIKKVSYDPQAKYPLGCNFAFYVGPENFMVEMESMGPETTLKPDQSMVLREIWTLTDKSYGLSDLVTVHRHSRERA